MALGWNEVKERAVRFSKEWKDAFNEEADAKQFLIEFFNVFGISNRRVATFEHRVKKVDDADGYIDLLWKGTLLVEMKSRGKNLDKAYKQAIDYTHGLKEAELPKYILVSDFANLRLYDLENPATEEFVEFKLEDLVNHVQLFGFIAGYQKRVFKEEDSVNIQAAERMGKLHDALKESGYTGHELEKYLVRLLFCLFADDTTIFEKGIFQEYILNRTNDDGTDLGVHIAQLFQVLNTPENKRQKNLDESLTQFPYINGDLFSEQLSFASFNSRMRQSLIECCELNWGKISPAIFGSMFQSVMDKDARRNLGAHYTSEKNILKLIKPLFLDELWKDFEKIKHNENKLKVFHNKIASLRFLDPACGCGNFLVITYRELRLLELSILKTLQKGQRVFNLESLIQCNVDRFYGIEYEEFPAQIAQVALWLIDHQMNMLISHEFGEYFVRLPLKKSAKILHGNALRTDWDSLLLEEKTISIHAREANIIQLNDPEMKYGKVNIFAEKINITDKPPVADTPEVKFDYIFGNPPFVGKNFQNKVQKEDLAEIFKGVSGSGNIDYVTAWYIKAAKYLQKFNSEETNNDCRTKVAFVSTNSITQGEQVGILWNELFTNYKIKIHFAHRTFKWGNEAKSNAAVHVVIIGFSNFDISEKLIFVYENLKGEPHEIKAKNINPYLTEGSNNVLLARTHPICNVPEMSNGSKVVDAGNLILDFEEKEELLKKEPLAGKYIRLFIGSDEYINNSPRWCLYLKNAKPEEFKRMPLITERVRKVQEMRKNSVDRNTQKWASFPALFMSDRQPETDYLLIPRVSSENRIYVPIGYLSKDVIISDRATSLPNANLFTFGVITSIMHMTWMKYTCGRLESRYNYSNSIVYNNFPWPENPTEKQKEAIEKAAQKVLDVRALFLNSSPFQGEVSEGRRGSGEGGVRLQPGGGLSANNQSSSTQKDTSLADLYNPLTMPPELVKAHNELDKAVDLAYRPQPFATETKRIEFLFELYDKYTAGLFAVKKGKKR